LPHASAFAPTLETERLRLRPQRVEDFDDSATLWSDPQVVRYIGGRASTREECWSRVLRNFGLWPALGYGYWVIEERASDRFVGQAGFADFKRDLTPSFDGTPEAGWVLAPWSHGKGYASEAMRAALAWLDDAQHAHSVCLISPDNAASINVAAKLGYVEYARTTYHDDPTVLYERV